MNGPPAELDVRTAISTIDKALSYTQPLRRRTEGLTWILFGLSSALFAMSYAWIWELGLDPTFRLVYVWLVGYALVGIGPALLTWRLAGSLDEDYAIDAKRVVGAIVVSAVLLLAIDVALWATLGETQLNIALNIAILGGLAWAGLGAAQWSKLSTAGRRDTRILAVVMVAVSVALVYALGANTATVTLDVLIFVVADGVIPMAAGLWRLAKA